MVEGIPAERVVGTARTWPGLAVERTPAGEVRFALGPRTVGRLDDGGRLRVALPAPLRERVLAAGQPGAEPDVDPASHWVAPSTAARPGAAADREPGGEALVLLRLGYLAGVLAMANSPVGGEALASLDLDATLAALDVDDDLRSALEAERGRRLE